MRPKGAPVVELQGRSYAACRDSRRMIAAVRVVSSGSKTCETPLSRLEESALEPGAREVDLGHRLAVQLDPALGQQAPRLAGRGDAEALDEERGQVDGVSGRQRNLRDLLGRLA